MELSHSPLSLPCRLWQGNFIILKVISTTFDSDICCWAFGRGTSVWKHKKTIDEDSVPWVLEIAIHYWLYHASIGFIDAASPICIGVVYLAPFTPRYLADVSWRPKYSVSHHYLMLVITAFNFVITFSMLNIRICYRQNTLENMYNDYVFACRWIDKKLVFTQNHLKRRKYSK